MLADPKPPLYGEATQQDTTPSLEPGIYALNSGQKISPEQLYTMLSSARFVIVGESHDDVFHHDVQRQVYEGLWHAAKMQGKSSRVWFGLEMIQLPYQGALDRFVKGEISESEMLEAVEWDSRWGYSSDFYAPMWTHAQQQQTPIIALNSPREISRKISQVGIDGLDADERALLPEELDFDHAAHRQWFEQMFQAHGGMSMEDRDMFERFYQAQVSWDETMAYRAVDAMKAAPAEDLMMIVAGSGHVIHGWGIPSRIERRLDTPDATSRVLTVIPVSSPASGEDLKAPTAVSEQQFERWQKQGYADFIWVQ